MKLPIRIAAAVLCGALFCSAQTRRVSAADQAGSASARQETRPYTIGPLDVLDIRVWNDPKLSGIFDVRPDGFVSMPLIGEIKADGLTVSDLTKAIKDKLSAVMNDPEVNIQPARINSKKVYVLGAVMHTGEMPLVGNMTVLDAISNCGGFKDFAKPSKIYVLRRGEKLNFNYKDVSKGKHMEQNIVLETGDHIFVPGD